MMHPSTIRHGGLPDEAADAAGSAREAVERKRVESVDAPVATTDLVGSAPAMTVVGPGSEYWLP